jgi:hypothetical protein
MDPYLEAHWGDLHLRFLVYLRDAIDETLPESLCARMDGPVVRDPGGEQRQAASDGAMPLVVDAEARILNQTFVAIRDYRDADRLVTVIQLLWPENKTPGEIRDAYRLKQREVCGAGVNLVEIDLLRAGEHTLAVDTESIPPALRTPYAVCVRRARSRLEAEVYPIRIAQPLPAIKVPLRPADPDLTVELQALIERCYRRAYEGHLDYNEEPVPPLTGPDAEWADRLLRERGLRTTPARAKIESKRQPSRGVK